MNAKVLIGLVAAIVIAGVGSYVALMWQPGTGPTREEQRTLVPVAMQATDATFLIEGQEVGVEGGQAVLSGNTESVERVLPRARVVQDPVTTDLNDDGAEDAALLLAYDPGGSGTFVCLAAALRDGEGFVGTNSVLLGDRVRIDTIEAQHGVITVAYRVHGEGQSMVEEPSESRTLYVTLLGAQLTDVGPLNEDEALFAGFVRRGESEFEFSPCAGSTIRVSDSSRATVPLNMILTERVTGTSSAAFMVLVGTLLEQGPDATSSPMLDVTRILSAPRHGSCP